MSVHQGRLDVPCGICGTLVGLHSLSNDDPDCPEMVRPELIGPIGRRPYFGIIEGPNDDDLATLYVVCGDDCLAKLMAKENW